MGIRHAACAIVVIAACASGAPDVAGNARLPDAQPALNAPSRDALTALRSYVGLGQRVMVHVAGTGRADDSDYELDLLDASRGRVVSRVAVKAGDVDLSALFPSLWVMDTPATRYVQLVAKGEPFGSPLVIEPLLTRPAHVDGWAAQILTAFERRDTRALQALMSLPEGARADLRGSVESRVGSAEPVWSGIRVYTEQRVVLETTLGALTLALRSDAAPLACHRFLSLVRDGFYDGTSFHRVIAEDANGNPYIVQGGDPTGTGTGGAGERFAFEASSLAHDLGVVSLARHPHDPNSASGQFFICLSRRGCAALDGRYTSFAQVVEGTDVLMAIAAVPVGPSRPDLERSSIDRPLDDVLIERARTVNAPAISSRESEVIPDGNVDR